METIYFILVGLPIAIVMAIIIVGIVIRFVRSFKHAYEPMVSPKDGRPNRIHPLTHVNRKVTPWIVSVIAPIGGFIISMNSSPHTRYDDILYTPLNHDHILTIAVLYAISAIAYWMSVWKGGALPPLFKAFSILGMAQGFVLCVIMMVQFGPFMLYGLFPIIITFPLLSPLLFLMLLFVEIRKQLYLQKIEIQNQEEDETYDSLILSNAERIVTDERIGNPLFFFFLIPFVAIQQAVLILFGQRPDSFIKAFAETCTYTFSQFDPPPNPGSGHYLCTIASRGHPTLVQPLRKGWRGGKVIDVNRQLMVSNAFEEWLEQHTPRFHRYLRGCYNKVGRPLNEMVKSTWISNAMYIIMKPFEWGFIFWLYMVDEHPENRIHTQYLSRKR